MYDFSKQKAMLNATLLLLEENNLNKVSTLGGGTALASYYWNHRYSTDIDIFIYDKVDKKHLLKESTWSEKVKTEMKSIGYNGNFRNHPIYSEIVIDEECKIQFFDVVKKSHIPYVKVNLWGHELLIDTVEEIIAKKIYYRANKGNSRDLFDIAIAFHNEPDILTKTLLKKDKVITLFETVSNIYNNRELKDLYLEEIHQMNPNKEYAFLAINTIEYLHKILENICGAYNIAHDLSTEEYIEIESYVCSSLT
ncbi:nucleotidyl transferase AbiEii/AbiGii toxin family protein [Poseidonibacter lekithochrous]|uniref:nucleotidyl transferase AbiEii/AbiGii toxin family protein n=1 Tax=Poseidonibacter TaxID=2321187 RepID=UPI001C08F056|nr:MULTISPECIES: nucleotidyl transferase AbiEii/AbiGii toxin family protein [Poseidonibacter]MBU3015205.1 nucleotidyl transferase AbiEii/AbiGii toxin family protein [Poseidonibacter lekithochrous]MDO6828503.1 nucleotidyl transferase AbiEii/AbiGii toxin family protein [Poseidonibacter sp. 1_MG-2023]